MSTDRKSVCIAGVILVLFGTVVGYNSLHSTEKSQVDRWLASMPEIWALPTAARCLLGDEVRKWEDDVKTIPNADRVLVGMLNNSTDPMERYRLITALGILGSDICIDALADEIGCYGDLLPIPQDITIEVGVKAAWRDRAIHMLRDKIGNDEVISRMSEIIRTGSESAKVNACVVLGGIGGDDAEKQLRIASKDTSALVRDAAVRELERRPSKKDNTRQNRSVRPVESEVQTETSSTMEE